MSEHNIRRRPLKNWQFILLLVLVFSAATLAAVWHVSQLQSRLIESTAIKNARIFSDALTEFRTLYTSEVVNTAKQYGLEITHDYAHKKNAIPLPATLSLLLAERLGEHTTESETMLYSPYPFPWRAENGGLSDDFKQDAWRFLSQNPDLPYFRFTQRDGDKRLRYATADIMRPDCIQCHNNHPNTPKNDWQEGDLRGVLEVDLMMDQVIAQTQADLRGTMLIFGTLALLGVIGIASVTSKLRRTSVELQQRVEERTAELTTKAQMLERSNRELDQFAYVTSHDLKAPLRAIANLSQWIEEDLAECLTVDTRQQMQLLRGRVYRMEALIQGILEYSRVGRVAEETERVEVSVLLDEVIDSIDPPSGFSIEVATDMPVIETSRIRLQQVFANLIGNAIKYHDRTDGKVIVEVEQQSEFYLFSVCDDGPGIAAEFHAKVFQIFQTLQARDQVESTGVGLSLVKKIVEDQGGEISLDSRLGEGARFRFTWPKQTES